MNLNSNHPTHIFVFCLLRSRLHAHVSRIYFGNSSFPNSRKRFCCYGNSLTTFSSTCLICFFSQNLVTIATAAFNQFVNPWAIAAIGWHYYIVYCAWLVIELLFIIIFIVETRGMFHDIMIHEDLSVKQR